ncbi:SGNH/GDSL hydrolase family protein [Spelaeicoccus albus]|uniref:Lysophospholipase L1-like esterase n=1 Tax=Spelaeicoccus albus TaxID=1280376 RepID=A0A7Z0A977_9MICO|nr:SGNH/GDSL hydrolase family protein [Spelaeicoccus albus]NYI66719.1 lysophospholipase L1-like esterase [Spelaeicoccus albus]
MVPIDPTSTVVFTGDSITDCGRRTAAEECPLGSGFPLLVAAEWAAKHPAAAPNWVNTGVSGDRIRELAARWTADVLERHPTHLTILIGINDVGRRYKTGDRTDIDEFRGTYAELLGTVAGVDLTLIEPFLVPALPELEQWREDLDPKRAVVRELAAEHGARLIRADDIFAKAAAKAPPSAWAPDGVHPTPGGHRLLAEAWLDGAEPGGVSTVAGVTAARDR